MANRVVSFIGSLKCTQGKGAGEPFELRPWQRAIIAKVYREVGGQRMVREVLLTCGRKNGKTELSAALALCHLAGPAAVARGEVFSAAQGRNEASRIFRAIEAFILADEELSRRCNIQRFAKRIEVKHGPGKGSTFEALSSDATKAHSLFPSFVVADELAQWRGRELFDNLKTGMGGEREQRALMWVISTKSPDPHSVMSEVTAYARQVQDGIIVDPAFAPFIFEVPEDVDPLEDESSWKLANPALGDFRSLSEMQDAAAKARLIPGRVSAFRRLYANQALEDEGEKFIPLREWQAVAEAYDAADLEGEVAYGGLDLGSTRDLTAFALYFPHAGGRTLVWTWCPGESVDQRTRDDLVPYDVWAREGLIEVTGGKATDKRHVVLKLAELAQRFEIAGIAYDRWGMAELRRILDEEGVVLPLVEHGQGYKDMSPAIAAFEERVLNRQLCHNANPVVTWALSNVRLSQDAAGGRKLDKDKARERIDPVAALVMAVGLHAKQPAPKTYDFSHEMVMAI
jgi:phage terminase large subunit-like protein